MRRRVFSRKWVKLNQDQFFSIFKSEHFLSMHISKKLRLAANTFVYSHFCLWDHITLGVPMTPISYERVWLDIFSYVSTSLLFLAFRLNAIRFFEHILCKDSIVIVKKFDFEILTYSYVLWSQEIIYAIFAGIYVCMCACLCVCVCVWAYVCVCAC